MHDFNGGIPKNGLFWTVQVPPGSFEIHDGWARLHVEGVPVLDSFEFAGVNVVPALVDMDVSWKATGPFEQRGSGSAVQRKDPAAFLGRIAPAESTARFSGTGAGFAFTAMGDTADTYAQIGDERNGNFLD